MNNKPYFSVIVPVYNEEGNIKLLFEKIKNSLDKLGPRWEVIFVNDGSRDHSEEEILELKNEAVRLISFTRNFGQTAAWAAGFDKAFGEILITIDSDLQNDPSDIGKMYKLMEEESADIVTGWRKKRDDPFLRSVFSRIANRIISIAMNSKIHDGGCSLRLIKKEVIKNLKLYGEMHRLLPFLFSGMNLKVKEIEVSHNQRNAGKSKYGFNRTFKVLLDLLVLKFLSNYQTKPIYLFGQFGFLFIFGSFLAGAWIFIRKVFLDGAWVSPMFFIMTTFFIVGILCILIGLLAEIMVRVWYEGTDKKPYEIKMMTDK